MADVPFHLDSPAFQADPAGVFARLRAECPLHRNDEPALHYSLSRDADVRAALRDDETWSSSAGPGLAKADPSRSTTVLVSSDPPKHTAERLAISRIFKPSAIEALEPDLRVLVAGLLDELAGRGRADLIQELGMQVPLTVMCWMLGTPVEDLELFRSWVLPMAEGVTYVTGSMDPRVAGAYKAFTEYFGEHIDRRMAAVGAGEPVPEDLLTRLLTVERDGQRLDRAQVLGFCQFLLVAGSATTTLLIGNVVHGLLTHPDQLGHVLADRSLVPNAIEESLRFDAPVHGLFRTNTCPVTLYDTALEPGTKVLMLFASGNRDPEAWEEPDRFDVTRDLLGLKKHLAFGYGIHYCLGAPLARLEATVALEAVLERLPGLRLDGEPVGVRASVLHGFEHLPVAWDVEVG